MLDIMFELPSDKNAVSCVMTKEAIDGEEKPKLIYDQALIAKEEKQPRKRGKKSLEETA